jgi:hypothetical protein
MENRIQRIIEIAVKAPSGHNYQPWNFRLDGNSVKIFNLPKRDMTIFNFKQRGSYIAHGAVIENIEIAAKAMGYAVDLTLFPDNDNSEFIASISFEETDPSAEPLYPSIFNRSTNRKPYKKISLNPEHRDKILDIKSD